MTLDPRTPEEKQRAADECYANCKKRGVTCAGCHLDYLCQMPQANARWLFCEFIPAIDPGKATFVGISVIQEQLCGEAK